jgi:hypothetical protein
MGITNSIKNAWNRRFGARTRGLCAPAAQDATGKFSGALARTIQTSLVMLAAVALGGCAQKSDHLVHPAILASPYDSARGETLWAVAPLSNESGVSTLDASKVSDALAGAVGQARGMGAIPVNRVLAAMAAKNIVSIRTPLDARIVAEALGVDGLIVGTVTAYDPYDPPKLGLNLALFLKERPEASNVDPKALRGSYTDGAPTPTSFVGRPTASISEYLDAASHEVLIDVKAYAQGRHDPDSALNWRRYTASMELYTEYAAYRCVRRLLEEERIRLAPPPEADAEATGGAK